MFRLADLLSRLACPSSHRTSKSAIRNRQSAIHSRRLFLESLEDRRVLSTFTVINTDDSGAGSLRQAIVDANDNAGHDTIAFNIPGSGVHTIAPLTNLPATSNVIIDATTQPGFTVDGPRLIELSGRSIFDASGASIPMHYPYVDSRGFLLVGDATVKGFAINRFDRGIQASSSNNHIEENYLGLEPSGTSIAERLYEVYGGLYDMEYGVLLSDAPNNVVGGSSDASRNVIAGTYAAVRIQNSSDNNRILGNYIGRDKDGTDLVGVSGDGIEVYTNGNHIGEPGAGNLVPGVYIGQGSGNTVQGNSLAGAITLSVGASDNLIGGGAAGARNVSGRVEMIGAHHNKVQGNYIGVDATGSQRTWGYVIVWNGAHDNIIGTDGDGIADETEGNLIGNGVTIAGGWSSPADVKNNVVAGNLIGTDATGMVSLIGPFHPDYQFGVWTWDDTYGTRIGTNGDGVSDEAERNVISGGWTVGVRANGNDDVIAGNYIGTNKAGDAAIPNVLGAEVNGLNVRFGANGDGVNDDDERNVVSGNLDGVWVDGQNLAAGNYIGTDATGLLPLGNGRGVFVSGANATIGGATPGARNVISGNLQEGIRLDHANGAAIQGNSIGVDKTGAGPLGNGTDGIWILHNSFNNLIGSAVGETNAANIAAAANIIAYNGRNGVTVSEGDRQFAGFETAAENSIRGNAIYENAGLGIDFANYPFHFGNENPILNLGVTPNDALDADAGPNGFQNYPVLTAASSGTSPHVQGSLHSTPNSTFTLDFYANSTVDPSGYGEGERWLGSASVTTDAAGNAPFNVVIAAASSAGEFITSTATDAVGNTSEFSQAVQSVLGVKTVDIDIQPESLNVDSNGLLTVVIFGAVDFDAAQVDVSSVHFAGAGVWQSTLVDANGDGRLDLQVKFRTQDTALEELYAQLLVDDQDADGVLDSTHQTARVDVTGQTFDDALFSGSDDINLFLAGRSLRSLLDELFG